MCGAGGGGGCGDGGGLRGSSKQFNHLESTLDIVGPLQGCGIVHAGSLSHYPDLLGHLIWTEPTINQELNSYPIIDSLLYNLIVLAHSSAYY